MVDHRDPTMEFRLESDLSEISRLATELAQISHKFNLNKADAHDVNLVLEEWFTNLILYGKIGRRKSEIIFRVRITGEKIYLEVIDEGTYFDPRVFKLPDLKKKLEERVPGGIGLHLIHKLMDRIDYHREENKNILRLEKFRTF